MIAWERSLGAVNCETCGTNFNEIVLEWDFDENCWQLEVRVGCYGGGQAHGTGTDILDYMSNNWSHRVTAKDFAEMKQVIESAKIQSWLFEVDTENSPAKASGTMYVQHINDSWDALLLDCPVDTGCEYTMHRGSWDQVRKWVHDQITLRYLSEAQANKMTSQIENEAAQA